MSDAFLDHRGRPRVAVTGMGVKTPGRHRRRDDVGDAARRPSRPRRRSSAFDPSDAPGAVRVRGPRLRPRATYFGPEGGPPPGPRHAARLRRGRRRARATPASSAPTPSRCAVIAATGVGGLDHARGATATIVLRAGRRRRVSPFFVPMMMPNATAGVISISFGWTGPTLCIATACAAGAQRDRRGRRG